MDIDHIEKQRLGAIEKEIIQHDARLIDHIFEIGRLLWEGKQIVGHGSFEKWVEAKFDFSKSTAHNYKNIFVACKGNKEAVKKIKRSILYEISTPNYPEILRDMVLSEPDMLKGLKVKDMKKIKKQVAIKGANLDQSQIKILLGLGEREIRYSTYRNDVKKCLDRIDRLSNLAESLQKEMAWPVYGDTGKTCIPKNVANKIISKIKRIESTLKVFRPTIQIISDKELRSIV